jgi:hypothetical protein
MRISNKIFHFSCPLPKVAITLPYIKIPNYGMGNHEEQEWNKDKKTSKMKSYSSLD